MSTVKKTELILPMFADSADATVEQMKAYTKAFADKFTEITGNLEIVKTEDTAYGAFFYLGEIGTGIPIIAIGNNEHDAYSRKGLIISTVNEVGSAKTRGYSSYSSLVYTGYMLLADFTKQDIYIKYVKSSKGFLFGFYYNLNGSTGDLGYVALITQLEKDTEYKKNFIITHSDSIYLSFCDFHDTDDFSQKLISNSIAASIMPSVKSGLMDLWLFGKSKCTYLKLFSGYFADGTIIEISGKKYVQFKCHKADVWSILMEID